MISLGQQAQRLVQADGESLPTNLIDILSQGIRDQPHVAAAGGQYNLPSGRNASPPTSTNVSGGSGKLSMR